MLIKVALKLLQKGAKHEKLSFLGQQVNQFNKTKIIHLQRFTYYNHPKYNFSTEQHKEKATSKSSEKAPNALQNQNSSNENAEIIEVSLQEFKKMKQLLQELKSEISELQQQQKAQHKTHREPDMNLSKKLEQFSKESKIPHEISEFVKQQDSSLFFKSLEQQLSFQLIKLNSKQQFNELIENYLAKFDQIEKENSPKQQPERVNQLIHLCYLIFYRYTSLQNTKFDDVPIKDLLSKISLYADILGQTEVEKLLSILNDQIKDRQSKFVNQQLNTWKIDALLHNNFQTFVQSIKTNLLIDNKVFNFKQKTNRNSQILSLTCQIFDMKQLYSPLSSFKLILQRYNPSSQISQKKTMVYNPINLSHLIINTLQSGKHQQIASNLYELFQLSLTLTKEEFQSLEGEDVKFQLEESLKTKTAKEFQRYQYEGIIYFLQNWPQTSMNNDLFLKFSHFLFSDKKSLKNFELIHQLRICLGFLGKLEIQKFNSSLDTQIVSQIQRILLSPQTQDKLFEPSRQDSQTFDADDNTEFLHLKKLSMILSQIGIQLFKNYRLLVKQKQSDTILQTIKEVILSILKSLNKICNEKVDLKDIFKNDQKQNVSQKLILNLNLFQFIVNLNILSKWAASLTNKLSDQQLTSELLTNLVSIFMGQTKNTLVTQHISDLERLKMAQQLVIVLLIGRQHETIVKNIKNYFEQSEEKQIFSEIVKFCIGNNKKHKYYKQYLLLEKQFEF